MPLRVEFYGIARQRVGVGHVLLDLPEGEATLAAVLDQVARQSPTFGTGCLAAGRLDPSLTANLDGQRFVADPATLVRDGQSLLILSADAGG